MKKNYFLLVLVLFSFNTFYAQPNLEWENNWAGPIYNDEGKHIAVDGDGNLYVAAVSDSITLKDWLIIKYNPDGDVLWTRRFNGSANLDDEPQDIKIDFEGNIYITGYLNNQKPTYYVRDMFTIKLSPTGTILWTKTEENVFTGLKIIIDVYGNVYIAGGDFNSLGYSYLYKYNSNGNLEWDKFIYKNYNQNAQTIKQMEFNVHGDLVILIQLFHAYFGGYYRDGFYVTEISPQNGETVFDYYKNAFIAKTMVLDKLNGNIYVSNQYHSNSWYIDYYTYHDHNGETYLFSGSGSSERSIISFKIDKFNRFYILEDWADIGQPSIWKYDPNGSSGWFKWFDMLDSNNDFTSIGLNIDKDEDNPDIIVLGNTTLGNIFTFKLSNYNADVIWEETYDCGNNKPDIAKAMFVDDCDNIYITGSSSCGTTYKDVKTIKYSTLEKPEIEVSEMLPLCYGDEVTLSVVSCEDCTYLWSSGQTTNSINVTPENTTYYTVTVTNSFNCEMTLDPLEVIVNPLLTPDVSIVSDKDIICFGESVMFTATPANGGLSPVFEWYVDGEMKSSGNIPEFTTSVLTDGSIVTCVLISSATCLTAGTATSNPIIIVVNPLLPVSIEITVNDNNICQGEEVVFSTETVNGGTNPSFNWYVDNQLQSETFSQFVTADLVDGVIVRAEVISNETCPDSEIASSNSIMISVSELLTPSVSITSSENSICQGENVTFSAQSVNGGTNPVYQWYIGNELQAANSNTFSTIQLNSGNQVYCILTSDEECLEIPTATSNFISVAVNPKLTPSVSISASSTSIFSCEKVVFTSSPTNGGQTPEYKWFVNGNLAGTSSTFTTTTLLDGAEVYCAMTSNVECPSVSTVNSNTLVIDVYPLPTPEIIISNDTIYIGNYSGGQYNYNWYYNGDLVSNSSFINCQDYGNGAYYVVVSINNCSVTSGTENITCSVGTNEIEVSNIFTIYPNPTSKFIVVDGKNLSDKTVTIKIYNLLGEKLIEHFINVKNQIVQKKIDLIDFPRGNYFMSIQCENHYEIFKIQKL